MFSFARLLPAYYYYYYYYYPLTNSWIFFTVLRAPSLERRSIAAAQAALATLVGPLHVGV